MTDSDSSSCSSTSSWVFVDENSTPQKTNANQFYLNCSKEPVQELTENDLPLVHSDIDSDDGISVISEPEHLKSLCDEFHQTASENEEPVENLDPYINQNTSVLSDSTGALGLKNILITTSLIGVGVVVVAILIVPYMTPNVANVEIVCKSGADSKNILSFDENVQCKQSESCKQTKFGKPNELCNQIEQNKYGEHRKRKNYQLKDNREENNPSQDSNTDYKQILTVVEEGDENHNLNVVMNEKDEILEYENDNYDVNRILQHNTHKNWKPNKHHLKENRHNGRNQIKDNDKNYVTDDKVKKKNKVNWMINEKQEKFQYENDDEYCKNKYKKRQKQLDAKQEYLTKKEEYLIQKEYDLFQRELLLEKLWNNAKHLKSKHHKSKSESKDNIKHEKSLHKHKHKAQFEVNSDKKHKKAWRKLEMGKKNNTKNGSWYSQMREGREDMRRQHHLSDWFFDRASIRSKLRNKARWYFHLMNGREERRETGIYPHEF